MGAATSRSGSTRSTTPHGTRTARTLVNMRAGQFRPIEDDGQASLKIPLNKIPTVSGARHPTFEDIDMQTRTLIEKLSVS